MCLFTSKKCLSVIMKYKMALMQSMSSFFGFVLNTSLFIFLCRSLPTLFSFFLSCRSETRPSTGRNEVGVTSRESSKFWRT